MINHLTLQSEGRDLERLIDAQMFSNAVFVYPVFAPVVPEVPGSTSFWPLWSFCSHFCCCCCWLIRPFALNSASWGPLIITSSIQLTNFCWHCSRIPAVLVALCPSPFKFLYSFEASQGEAVSDNFLQPLLRDCRRVHGLADHFFEVLGVLPGLNQYP